MNSSLTLSSGSCLSRAPRNTQASTDAPHTVTLSHNCHAPCPPWLATAAPRCAPRTASRRQARRPRGPLRQPAAAAAALRRSSGASAAPPCAWPLAAGTHRASADVWLQAKAGQSSGQPASNACPQPKRGIPSLFLPAFPPRFPACSICGGACCSRRRPHLCLDDRALDVPMQRDWQQVAVWQVPHAQHAQRAARQTNHKVEHAGGDIVRPPRRQLNQLAAGPGACAHIRPQT
eukprot:365233-Chlamydomonas_euryale.AAC.4